jgi:hypothetical protein
MPVNVRDYGRRKCPGKHKWRQKTRSNGLARLYRESITILPLGLAEQEFSRVESQPVRHA